MSKVLILYVGPLCFVYLLIKSPQFLLFIKRSSTLCFCIDKQNLKLFPLIFVFLSITFCTKSCLSPGHEGAFWFWRWLERKYDGFWEELLARNGQWRFYELCNWKCCQRFEYVFSTSHLRDTLTIWICLYMVALERQHTVHGTCFGWRFYQLLDIYNNILVPKILCGWSFLVGQIILICFQNLKLLNIQFVLSRNSH